MFSVPLPSNGCLSGCAILAFIHHVIILMYLLNFMIFAKACHLCLVKLISDSPWIYCLWNKTKLVIIHDITRAVWRKRWSLNVHKIVNLGFGMKSVCEKLDVLWTEFNYVYLSCKNVRNLTPQALSNCKEHQLSRVTYFCLFFIT
jgi:hypothetical protein